MPVLFDIVGLILWSGGINLWEEREAWAWEPLVNLFLS
jgi:hypothetical protein